MRRDLVVLVDEGVEPDLDIVEGGHGAEVVEAALAQRPPEALHLAAGRRVVRPGVQERDAEPGAGGAEDLADVGRAVVEVEHVGRAVLAQGPDQDFEHVGLALGVARLDGDDEPAGVVEQGVDAQGTGLAVDGERRAVADIGVPEGTGARRLPAKPRLLAATLAHRRAVSRSSGRSALVLSTSARITRPVTARSSRISGTEAERCSRRMSRRSWRCSGVSSWPWPRSLRGAGRRAAKPPLRKA